MSLETQNLSRTSIGGQLRPRIDLRTRGGALTRVVRRTGGRRQSNNMPVDWRILDIEAKLLDRLGEISDIEDYARWVQRHVVLNVLSADNNQGLTLFDRANNRGVKLEWHELVKSVLTEAVGQVKVDQTWYEMTRDTKHEFSDLILSAAFIPVSYTHLTLPTILLV